MSDVRVCPSCGSHDTERVHTEFTPGEVHVTRLCDNCPTQYEVWYGDPYKCNVDPGEL